MTTQTIPADSPAPNKKRFATWKKVTLTLVVIITGVVLLCVWFISLIDKQNANNNIQHTVPTELAYLSTFTNNSASQSLPSRGRILAVVTSASTMGESGKKTGYELTELSRAYYVFRANGFDVDIASPKGGLPPIVIDNDDMGQYDYAFLNDVYAQEKATNSLPINEVDPSLYEAVYFIGGKGAMFDFPDNLSIQQITASIYQQGGVIGAVCHGPAALANVKLSNGKYLIEDRQISAFTNAEELFLIPDAEQVFPFLLESKLREQGANVVTGAEYLEQVSIDGRLVTGQNPWSVWAMAEAMITQLGYEPVSRPITAEENSVSLLMMYQQDGYAAASAFATKHLNKDPQSIDRNLVLMHAIVNAMNFEFGDMVNLVRLVSVIKSAQVP